MSPLRYIPVLMFLLSVGALSCNKDEFLGKKPSSNIIVPTRLEELKGLLDNESVVYFSPLLGVQSADEYYWLASDWQAQKYKEQNAYVWTANIYEGESFPSVNDWDAPFEQVFVANIVLEGVNAIDPTANQLAEWHYIKGAALFLRAKALFSLAEVFAMPYNAVTAASLPGLPLRLDTDIQKAVQRSSLSDTYSRILSDLHEAKELLTEVRMNPNRLRPTKLTAYALLARIYLSQREYELAGAYADSVLKHYSTLMDYNGMTSFVATNAETLYQNVMGVGSLVFSTASGVMHVDSNLYRLYDNNDRRKTLFYKTVNGRITLNRTYTGLVRLFSGLATDEMYLIRAERNARKGELDKAATDINHLLKHRYAPGTYTNQTFPNKEIALQVVLQERRKELAFRGTRWSDIRRLNEEGAGITLRRVLNGVEYTLPPKDKRYALYIPPYEIELSGIEQNPRN